MPVMTYREALRSAMAEEMERDESVVLLGEDIGVYGGTHLVTDGLLDRFGPKRVIDTPDRRGRLHRRRDRHGDDGDAPDRRDDDLELLLPGRRPDHPERGQAALLLRRAGRRAAGHPRSERRRRAALGAAHPQPGRVLRSLPRAEGRLPGDAARRQGDDADRDPRPEPGHLPGGRRALRHQGRGAGGRVHGRRSARRASPARGPTSPWSATGGRSTCCCGSRTGWPRRRRSRPR